MDALDAREGLRGLPFRDLTESNDAPHGDGMIILRPSTTVSLVMLLARRIASADTLYFALIPDKVSPFTTVWTTASARCGGAETGGGVYVGEGIGAGVYGICAAGSAGNPGSFCAGFPGTSCSYAAGVS